MKTRLKQMLGLALLSVAAHAQSKPAQPIPTRVGDHFPGVKCPSCTPVQCDACLFNDLQSSITDLLPLAETKVLEPPLPPPPPPRMAPPIPPPVPPLPPRPQLPQNWSRPLRPATVPVRPRPRASKVPLICVDSQGRPSGCHADDTGLNNDKK